MTELRGIIPRVKQVEPNQQEQQVTAEDTYPVEIPDGTACRNIRYRPHWFVNEKPTLIALWVFVVTLIWSLVFVLGYLLSAKRY